jgi:hypothetical protein
MLRSISPSMTSRSASSALASMSLMNDVAHRLGGAVHRGPDAALEEVGVREEEPVLDAVDDHSCGDAGIRMLDDVDVPVCGGGPAEDGIRGPGRAPDDVAD